MRELRATTTQSTAISRQASVIERFQASLRGALLVSVRGGGGNFGVVTAFEYQLHPVGTMLAGMVIYPIAQATALLRLYREVTRMAPDALGSLVALGTLPDGPQAAVLLAGCTGPLADGEKLLRPLREFGPPLADQLGPSPYTALQGISEHFNPRGHRNYLKTNYLTARSDDAIDTIGTKLATVTRCGVAPRRGRRHSRPAPG